MDPFILRLKSKLYNVAKKGSMRGVVENLASESDRSNPSSTHASREVLEKILPLDLNFLIQNMGVVKSSSLLGSL